MSSQFPAKLSPLFRPARYKILYGGRGAAKSWGIARALLEMGWQKPLRILCAREIQRTIADSVHRLLSDQVMAMGLEGQYAILENGIRGKNGTEFVFAGLRQQDVHKIKSFEGIDVVWVEEAHVVTKRSWEILIPTIRKEGSEIWLSFNPELDSDETYRRFVLKPPPGSVLINLNWRDNPWFPEVLKVEKDHLEATDKAAYLNIWEGECRSTVEGAIYKSEIEALYKEPRRVRPVPHDPLLKTHTIWDLGWNDQTSIIFVQKLHSEIRIIRYIEDSHRQISDYVADLKDLRYNWGVDYLPHDGAYADIKSGTTVQSIMQRLGRNAQVVAKMPVEQGIKLARQIFSQVYFDEDNASELVNRLKRYRRQIPVSTNEPTSPLHDENSHGADAFRCMAQVVDRMTNEDQMYKKLNYPSLGAV